MTFVGKFLIYRAGVAQILLLLAEQEHVASLESKMAVRGRIEHMVQMQGRQMNAALTLVNANENGCRTFLGIWEYSTDHNQSECSSTGLFFVHQKLQ